MEFKKLDKLVDVRSKLAKSGSYTDYGVGSKTDIAIHHSLTKVGDAFAFANYHVHTLGWHGIGYHFVIKKDGTIQWCHDLGILSYHVGNSNKFSLGICLVGDFRHEEPTEAQKDSLKKLYDALKKDLPNYERTRGHNEFAGYSWKLCPVFDYKAVIYSKKEESKDQNTHKVQRGDTFWSISRKYGVSVDALQKANKGIKTTALPIGGVIHIPNKVVQTSSPKKSEPNMKTTSVVTYLKSIGKPSDFNYRKQLAKDYGISGYSGTAKQNLDLLAYLRGEKKKPSSSLPKGVFKKGDRGNDVKKIQEALNKLNFKCGAADGIYGAKTKDAVERFQMVYDPHNVDGIYGSRTRERMLKQLGH